MGISCFYWLILRIYTHVIWSTENTVKAQKHPLADAVTVKMSTNLMQLLPICYANNRQEHTR